MFRRSTFRLPKTTRTITRSYTAKRGQIHPTKDQPAEPVVERKLRSYPTNHQIPHQVVRVQESDGTLLPSVDLPNLLASIDRSTHLVRLISDNPPIVRVLTHIEDKMEKLERKAQVKAQKNRGPMTTKEVRLTWTTNQADYEHKIIMARRELERGDVRIDFYFASASPGLRRPSRYEIKEKLQTVADSLADVSNEWRERDIFNGMGKLYLQSTVRTTKVMPTKSELEELAKKSLGRGLRW